MQRIENFVSKLKQSALCDLQVKQLDHGIYRISQANKTPVVFYTEGHSDPSIQKDAIHIEDVIWKAKKKIIINRLQAAWGFGQRIYARQTTCKRVNRTAGLEFQEENHMLVPLPGKYRYGLYFKQELVTLAVFSGLRKMGVGRSHTSIEMLRFCHNGNRVVVGGLSKLIAAMLRELNPDDIMTYVDQNWSNGKKFEKVGFEITGDYRDPENGLYSLKLIRKNKKNNE